MNILSQTKALLLKEFRLEFRKKYAISGILLYVLSTVFIVYITLGEQLKGARAMWGSFLDYRLIFIGECYCQKLCTGK